MAHQSRDVMAGLEAWRVNGHMGAMCSARARALVQLLTRLECRKARKMRKNWEKLGRLWRIHNIIPLLVPSVLTKVLAAGRAKTVGPACRGVE